jgi:8-oxo-dGTP diphosphatase
MQEGKERPIVIVAACALVNEDGALLIARRPRGRPMAGLWELPGGKVEAQEEPEDALVRELREELSIEVAKADLAPFTFASHAYPDFHLLMPVYLCRRWEGEATATEGQELRWVEPDALSGYDMPPADEPLKIALRDLKKTFERKA